MINKIKNHSVYTPKQKIKDTLLYDVVYVSSVFLWWVRTEDLFFTIKRWTTKKKFLENYEYERYIPTHQEMG
jgi:hypothetical protein